jgi:hypothetical protein
MPRDPARSEPSSASPLDSLPSAPSLPPPRILPALPVTLTFAALTIHDRFYPVTLQSDAVEVSQIRLVDLATDPDWRPTRRTNGFANSHYQSGWFRVANGQKVRLYRAGGGGAVLFPPKTGGTAVLYQAANPEEFMNEVRASWNPAARSNVK